MITVYTRYPREFITYKWYRPVLTAILFFVFYLILGALLFIGYGKVQGGSIALMIPALALANLIAGKSPGRQKQSFLRLRIPKRSRNES